MKMTALFLLKLHLRIFLERLHVAKRLLWESAKIQTRVLENISLLLIIFRGVNIFPFLQKLVAFFLEIHVDIFTFQEITKFIFTTLFGEQLAMQRKFQEHPFSPSLKNLLVHLQISKFEFK